MLITLARTIAFLLLLPAVGIAVAAATFTQSTDESTETPEVVETLPRGVVVDGRQDQSSYSHIVKLDSQGRFHGTLSLFDATGASRPIADLPVRLSQQGQVHAVVKTDADGRFVFSNVVPGVYSVFAQDSRAIFSAAIYLTNDQAAGNASTLFENAAIGPENVAEVARIRRFNLPNVALIGSEQNNANTFAKVMRQSFYSAGTPGLIDLNQVAQEDADKLPSLSSINQTVTLSNGELRGQLSQIYGTPVDFRSIHCFLVSNGETVSEVTCDDQGAFAFPNVKPGIYGFVAAGTGGFAALSLNVVDADSLPQARVAGDGTFFVNTVTMAAQVSVAMSSQQDSGDIGEGDGSEGEGETPPPPATGTTGTTTGGGGGGGGSGIDGAGALIAGLFGLGAGALLADDDNDAQAFASPFIPR